MAIIDTRIHESMLNLYLDSRNRNFTKKNVQMLTNNKYTQWIVLYMYKYIYTSLKLAGINILLKR